MSKWQPIETAPKDRTLILLFDPEAIAAIPYDADADISVTHPIFVGFWSHATCGRDYWNLAHYSGYSFEPTHWMPLPGPPALRRSADSRNP
jgi:hypothetical protein